MFLFTHYLGNRLLTLLTNVLYNTMLTDMETCFKAMRVDVLRSMTLKSNRFGIEPEMTAKIFKRGYRVYEIPITYDGRGYDDGKKITWRDGVVARLDAVEVPVHRVKPHPLKRLFGYAKPYRGRLILAIVAMVVYAAGDAGQAFLIKPIVDKTLRFGDGLALMAWGDRRRVLPQGRRLVRVVVPDDGRRPARRRWTCATSSTATSSDSRPRSSRSARTGQLMSRISNDVAQVQQAVSETIGDLARESLAAIVLAGYLFYIDARLTLVLPDRRAAHRLSARPARAGVCAGRRGAARRRSSTSRT